MGIIIVMVLGLDINLLEQEYRGFRYSYFNYSTQIFYQLVVLSIEVLL